MNKSLEELAHIYNGTSYKNNPAGDKIPIYGTGGLMGYTSVPLYTGPAVLSGRKGSINNPMYVEGEFWNVDTIFCIKANEGIHTKWLYYNFLNTDLSSLNEATGVPSVTSKALYKLKFKWFEYFEQCKISSILSVCDSVIEKTLATIDKYKAIKQGMLHDLFTRGIDPATGKLRPKYEDAPALYKKSKLGMVPVEWVVEELMKFLSYISYGFTNPMPETNDGPFLVTAANVNNGRIQYETCRKTSKDAHDNLLTDKSRPKIHDILLTKDGTLGRVALVEQEYLCINQSVAVLRPNKLINPLFLKILLESPGYQKIMIDEAGGSTIKHIYITKVDKMLLSVPKLLKEQETIVERLTSVDEQIQNEQSCLLKTQMIKSGLMCDLLSGRKRVSAPEEVLAVAQ